MTPLFRSLVVGATWFGTPNPCGVAEAPVHGFGVPNRVATGKLIVGLVETQYRRMSDKALKRSKFGPLPPCWGGLGWGVGLALPPAWPKRWVVRRPPPPQP
jgi:hypothetical protein